MREAGTQLARRELKVLVAEAAKSLERLEADRLEELALSCQALNRDLTQGDQPFSAREARAAKQDMAVLAKLLEATRANVAVMDRLRQLHASRTEYVIGQGLPVDAAEASDGHH